MKLTNEVLKEYVELTEQRKAIDKRLEEIKAACKEEGSFQTRDYVCSVDTQYRTGLPGIDEVTKQIQKETLVVLGLIRTIPVVTVRVTPRNLAAVSS